MDQLERKAPKRGFGTVEACVLAVATVLALSGTAAATEQFAKDTGKACGACHQSAQGGGPLTPFGDKFKANGDKLPPSTRWSAKSVAVWLR